MIIRTIIHKKSIRIFLSARRGLAISLLFSALTAGGQVNDDAVQRYIDSIHTANGFPGMSVSIVKDGKVNSYATGVSNLVTKKALTTKDLMFSGSTGKMFFALLTMRLIKEGKLSLDDKIEKYLGAKEWFARLPNANTITIKNLLNHSTGIDEYYPLGDFLKQLKEHPDRNWRIEELISYVLDRKALFAAGEGFGYADTNYLILGMILEELLKKDPFDVVVASVIKPLRLQNTVPSSSRKMKVATGYIGGNLFPWKGSTYDSTGLLVYNPKFEMMGGGFASTPGDMARYVDALMHGKLIDTISLSLMKTGITANTGRNHQYGLGLQIRPYPGGFGYGHSGWFPGYITDIEYYPKEDVTIAVQFNTDESAKLRSSRMHMLNILKLL